jgi:hypothetical protein
MQQSKFMSAEKNSKSLGTCLKEYVLNAVPAYLLENALIAIRLENHTHYFLTTSAEIG